MADVPSINRAAVYRASAREARQRAEKVIDSNARAILLKTAELWDIMAAYEETHNLRPYNAPQ
jgi:hypothetical protein